MGYYRGRCAEEMSCRGDGRWEFLAGLRLQGRLPLQVRL
jgi:hypothetical protein